MEQPGGGALGESHLREEGEQDSTKEVFTESRRGNPAKYLKLCNTGFARNLADKRQLIQGSTDIV